MEKMTYQLKGLDCANCAAKIESKVNAMDGIEEALLDFSQSKLIVSGTGDPELQNKITAIVKELEPDVDVNLMKDAHAKREKFSLKNSLLSREGLRLLSSLVLFALGLLTQGTLSLVFLAFAYILSGYKVLRQSVRNIRRGDVFDENFLMSLATLGAIAIRQYPEAAAVMIFYEIGEFFQDLAVDKSRDSISSLMDIRPDKALLITEDGTQVKTPDMIKVGQTIRVIPGERVPLDGTIVKGDALVDTSALTGESKPVVLQTGDDIISGSVVTNRPLEIKVTKAFSESTVSRILDLVENATANKAKTENFITKFARYYTPAVVFAALALVLIPTLIYGTSTFSTWLYRGLIFLVVSCPCALVVSIPLGFFSGIGNASKNGILIKGSNYLEALGTIDTVVFDKTGTLTEGHFSVDHIEVASGFSEEDLVKYASKAEAHTTHPIGKSIIDYQESHFPQSPSLGFADLSEQYEEISGKGIKAFIDQKWILVGNEQLLETFEVPFTPIESIGTVVYISINQKFAGYIELKDAIKKDAQETIAKIKALGKKTLMLTGDNRHVAESVSKALGIDQFKAELLPQDKYDTVKSHLDQGENVAFLGDGINDAPVLAAATVGISMGSIGSDAAIEASDIVIMEDEPSKLSTAIKISNKTKRIVIQNIVFALGVKLIVMALGALGISTMWMAIFADVGVALLAILNSMRVLIYKPA